MEENTVENINLEVKRAVDYIEMIRGQISQMGANSNEFDLLSNILKQLRESHITPNDAIRQADKILWDKDQNF